jgi:hypothetical protein
VMMTEAQAVAAAAARVRGGVCTSACLLAPAARRGARWLLRADTDEH